MEYEVVVLEEKTVVGLCARTNNMDPQMGAVIGGLWQKFYQPDMYPEIQTKKNEKSLGIYTGYAEDEKADYDVLVACEVASAASCPEGMVIRSIPAGKYAKFVVKGHMQKAVADFWQELWTMELPRAFVSDFEEYQNADMEQAEIHIYIGLLED